MDLLGEILTKRKYENMGNNENKTEKMENKDIGQNWA